MQFLSLSVMGQFNTILPFEKPIMENPLKKLYLDSVTIIENSFETLVNQSVNNENKKGRDESPLKSNYFFYAPLRSLTYKSLFGLRIHPIFHKLKLHAGVDLKACYDTVYAIARGIIKNTGYGEKEGNFVLITHNTVESIYCHLAKLNCVEGQNINGGDCIGISGNTGNSTGPHLHFGMKYKGLPINPLIYLKNIINLNK